MNIHMKIQYFPQLVAHSSSLYLENRNCYDINQLLATLIFLFLYDELENVACCYMLAGGFCHLQTGSLNPVSSLS